MGSNIEKIELLQEIRKVGGWKTESSLMGSFLLFHPATFNGLSSAGIDFCLARASAHLGGRGHKKMHDSIRHRPGRCKDLWENDDF